MLDSVQGGALDAAAKDQRPLNFMGNTTNTNSSRSQHSETSSQYTASLGVEGIPGPGHYQHGQMRSAETAPSIESIEVEILAKVLVVGNAKCGKSSIISRYTSGSFNTNYKTTIGADFVRKDVLVDLNGGVRVQLWDIAGQDRFQKLTRAYFSNAKAVVVVCDVSREGTIDAIRKWKQEVDRYSHLPKLPVVLLANKCDLLQDAAHAFKFGAVMERLCVELGFLSWWTCSARTGEALNEAFQSLLREVVRQDLERETSDASNASMRGEMSAAGNRAFRLESRAPDATDKDEDLEPHFTDCC
eukprot:GSChrysophyteH1.ASY1.ANO1.2269.1 assembled CDS